MIVTHRYVVQYKVVSKSPWRNAGSFRRKSPAIEESMLWLDSGAFDSRVVDTKAKDDRNN